MVNVLHLLAITKNVAFVSQMVEVVIWVQFNQHVGFCKRLQGQVHMGFKKQQTSKNVFLNVSMQITSISLYAKDGEMILDVEI